MKLKRRKVQDYVDNLKSGKSFALARYGDGEILTILGHYGLRNSNGCTFTKALGSDLRRVLKKHYDYDYSLLRIAVRKKGLELEKWLLKNDVQIDWVLGDFLLRANIDGKLYPLIEQIRERKVLYVGPRHCRGLHDRFFELAMIVHPPPQDAHKQKLLLENQIFNALELNDIDFIGFSAGLAAKVFIGDVWEYTNGEIPIMDFGSMWDGYFKVPSRSYIRRGNVNFDKLIEINTGGSNVSDYVVLPG